MSNILYSSSFGVSCTELYCYVCSTGLPNNLNGLTDHSYSNNHQQLARQEYENLSRIVKVDENFQKSLMTIENNRHRINRLGLPQWRRHILAECNFTSSGHCTFPEALLLRYEMKERISLLEIAAWKAACIYRQDEIQRERDIRAHWNWLAAKSYVENDWKEYRTEMRHSNRVNIIVERVVSFLLV